MKIEENDITCLLEVQTNRYQVEDLEYVYIGANPKFNSNGGRGSGGILLTSKSHIEEIYKHKEDQILVADTFGVRILTFYIDPKKSEK